MTDRAKYGESPLCPSHLDRRRNTRQPTLERIRRAQKQSLSANTKPITLTTPPWAKSQSERRLAGGN